MKPKVYEFNAALVRRPARTVTAGLRAVDQGDPTYEGVCAEHDAYVAALRQAGVRVEILEPLEAYPDSIFVEDPALVFTSGAILLRPGNVSREGEADLMEPVLNRYFGRVLRLQRGYVDGGDVLRTPHKVMIGLSARTTREGAEALVESLDQIGETGVIVKTPDNVLHLKSDCSLLDDDTILSTKRLASSGIFSGFKQIVVPDGEEAAANALRVNDRVFVGEDYSRTIALLEAFYKTVPLRTSEIRKIDAGLSCMSLRWHAIPISLEILGAYLMTRSSPLIVTLILLTAVPALVSSATDSQPPAKPPIDETGTVHVPAFDIPLSSYMSDQAKQAFIKAAAAARSSGDDWKSVSIAQLRARGESELQKYVDRARVLYPVNVEERRLAGVRTRVVTPKDGVAAYNRDHVLINVHGGGFFTGAGNEALIESIPVASLGKLKVVTVDYREGPEYSYPAASEDTASVYGELLKEYKPANVGIYGCSAGGILTAMAVAWFQNHQLPAPGAIGIFGAGAFGAWYGPPSILGSWSGDSAYTAPPLTGEKPVPLDPKQADPIPDYMSAYLRKVDLADPLVSPALSSAILSKFPPTLLITGTRAWDMSAAAQTQRALTIAGVQADLHVWDGMGHCFFFDVDLPESKEAFAVMTKFFDSQLERRAGIKPQRR